MKKKGNNYLLELASRRKIYNFILNHPGTYLREISREIKTPKSTVDYHLHYLKQLDLINIKTGGRYKRYYIKEEVGRFEEQSLNVLRKKTALHIALILSFRHVRTRRQLSEELEKAQSTVSFHLNQLIKADVVEKFKEDKLVKYRLRDEKWTDKLLIQYKEGLLDELVVTFYDYYLYWKREKWLRLAIKFLYDREKIKVDYDFIWEIFPHPYWG